MKYLGLIVAVLSTLSALYAIIVLRDSFTANGWLCSAIWSFSHFLKVKDE